jgi:hypothetical protein
MVEKINKKDKRRIREDVLKGGESGKNNRLLGGILLFLGILLLIIFISFFIIKSQSQFKYHDMKFNVTQQGEITFYQTYFNVIYKERPAIYNIYLRNDPRKLEKNVPFEGDLNLRNILVLNTTTENLFCEGDWSIAIANMKNLEIFNIKVISDENASCDTGGRYMFVQIEEGNESKIEQYGPSCYKLIVSDCEILPVTERFMIETFDKVNEELAKKL